MDLALSYNRSLDAFDLSIDALAGDLAREDTLATAVLLSLMTDRLAQPGDVDAGADRRGWWADAYAEIVGDNFGSRLWLLEREKQLPAIVQRARDYVREALQWLVDDGFATSMDVAVFVPRTGWMVADVQLQLDGASRRYRFEWSDADQVWRLSGEIA